MFSIRKLPLYKLRMKGRFPDSAQWKENGVVKEMVDCQEVRRIAEQRETARLEAEQKQRRLKEEAEAADLSLKLETQRIAEEVQRSEEKARAEAQRMTKEAASTRRK